MVATRRREVGPAMAGISSAPPPRGDGRWVLGRRDADALLGEGEEREREKKWKRWEEAVTRGGARRGGEHAARAAARHGRPMGHG